MNRTDQSDPIPSTTEPIKREPIGLPVTQPTKRVSTKDEYIGNPQINRFIVEVWFNAGLKDYTRRKGNKFYITYVNIELILWLVFEKIVFIREEI